MKLMKREPLKSSYKNGAVNELYKNYLGEPLSERCLTLLHTTYKERKVYL